MIYQELSLAPDLSVEDNIMLGQEIRRAGFLRRGPQRATVAAILKQLGHPDSNQIDWSTRFRLVPSSWLKSPELSLPTHESSSSMKRPAHSPSKIVERLFAIIQQLQSQGMAIIYISHFLEEIRRVADQFVVLRDGRPAGSGRLQEDR